MQDPNPLPWGALDRFQAHFIVRRSTSGSDFDFTAKSILKTRGHFQGKELISIAWNGGRIAQVLNQDTSLNELIAKQTLKDASIFIEPTNTGIRIHNKWKNHLDFDITKDMFEIYDKIAAHIKSL